METLKFNCKDMDTYAINEAYKFLRTNILFCGRDIKTICITSCDENEGKTTVSLNLAKSLAQLGKKVLFIDADMRKSVVAGKYFNAKNVTGLSELLSGIEKNVNNCVMATDVPGFKIVFAGAYPPNPVELLSGKYFETVVASARETFDFVIIDAPPVGLVADPAIIAPGCDGTLFVVGEKKLNRKAAEAAVTQLRNGGSHIIGFVRNNPKTEKY